MIARALTLIASTAIVFAGANTDLPAQDKIKVVYSSADATNFVWYAAQDAGFYKKHGLEVELIFVPSSTTAVSSMIAGDIQIGNNSGGTVASAVVSGANLVLTGCYINTLPYELVVHESIKSADELRGKSIGISRVGSASDSAARVLIKGLGLEPVKDVPILQVGGTAERAAAFRGGRIVGFPSPPGVIHLAQGMPHRILISTADFQKRYEFPFICSSTTKTFLAARRDTVRRVTMALIEATQFLKTRKEESKRFIGKFARQNNPRYLEDSYNAMAKLHDRVPVVGRVGAEEQIKESLSRKPGATMKAEDWIDDSIVRELEKSGFIDKVYGQK
jgi:NitT/TauT family transport system substrate-binding protein